MLNIIEIVKQKGDSIGIKYYGIEDMATGIMVKQMLENKNGILAHYTDYNVYSIDNYIDYIFIELTTNFFEVVPLVIENKREEFLKFLESCKLIYEKYNLKEVIKYLNNKYLDIYKFEDKDAKLFIRNDLRTYTSNLIGKYNNNFSQSVIDYLINEITYDVIDNFEFWKKYFINNPKDLKKLFSEENINKTFSLRFEEIASIIEDFKNNKKFDAVIKDILEVLYKIITEKVFNPQNEQEILQNYYAINDCLIFFKKMKSHHVYELEKEFKKQEEGFNENILKNGKTMEIKMDLKPFREFFEDEEKPWELRIVWLTHNRDENGKLVSYLEQGVSCETKSLFDELVKKNPGTTEYFTNWRLRNISLYSFEIKSRILLIMSDYKKIENYISSIYGELNYICSNVNSSIQEEEIDKNMEMLTHCLTDIFLIFPFIDNFIRSSLL